MNPPKDLNPDILVGVFFIKFFYLGIFTYIYNSMKKYTFILAISAALALTACGSGSSTNEATDSTAAQVDTVAVPSADTTVVVDTLAIK